MSVSRMDSSALPVRQRPVRSMSRRSVLRVVRPEAERARLRAERSLSLVPAGGSGRPVRDSAGIAAQRAGVRSGVGGGDRSGARSAVERADVPSVQSGADRAGGSGARVGGADRAGTRSGVGRTGGAGARSGGSYGRSAGSRPVARRARSRRQQHYAPVRLTRRGKLVAQLLLIVAALLTAVGIAAGTRAAADAPPPAGQPPSVVVEPGDTLWNIAERHAPDVDRRAVIAEIRRLNHLDGSGVEVGQMLILPRR
jgi:hypothetical protein